MYEPLLLIHSWTRWVVLLAMIYFLFRSLIGWKKKQIWTGEDTHFMWAFDQVFGYQVAFGLMLWLAFSPFPKAAFKDHSLITSDPVVFFWTIQHGLTMLIAITIFQIGHYRAKKSHLAKNKFKTYTLTFAIILALIISAIPWPWLSYGRVLFRWIA